MASADENVTGYFDGKLDSHKNWILDSGSTRG